MVINNDWIGDSDQSILNLIPSDSTQFNSITIATMKCQKCKCRVRVENGPFCWKHQPLIHSCQFDEDGKSMIVVFNHPSQQKTVEEVARQNLGIQPQTPCLFVKSPKIDLYQTDTVFYKYIEPDRKVHFVPTIEKY